jgi:predicted ATP-dependent endonuclease of OLD family
MRLSRVSIRNFRNFKNLDVRLGKHAVFLGENKIQDESAVRAAANPRPFAA